VNGDLQAGEFSRPTKETCTRDAESARIDRCPGRPPEHPQGTISGVIRRRGRTQVGLACKGKKSYSPTCEVKPKRRLESLVAKEAYTRRGARCGKRSGRGGGEGWGEGSGSDRAPKAGLLGADAVSPSKTKTRALRGPRSKRSSSKTFGKKRTPAHVRIH